MSASLHRVEEHLWTHGFLHVPFAVLFTRFHQDLGWLTCLRSPTFRHDPCFRHYGQYSLNFRTLLRSHSQRLMPTFTSLLTWQSILVASYSIYFSFGRSTSVLSWHLPSKALNLSSEKQTTFTRLFDSLAGCIVVWFVVVFKLTLLFKLVF